MDYKYFVGALWMFDVLNLIFFDGFAHEERYLLFNKNKYHVFCNAFWKFVLNFSRNGDNFLLRTLIIQHLVPLLWSDSVFIREDQRFHGSQPSNEKENLSINSMPF